MKPEPLDQPYEMTPRLLNRNSLIERLSEDRSEHPRTISEDLEIIKAALAMMLRFVG